MTDASARQPSVRSVPSLLQAVLLMAALVAAGCGAQWQPSGPETVTASIGQDHFVMSDGYRLPFDTYLPQGDVRAVAIALHGFNDHKGAWSEPATRWSKGGIAVYAYDQRGFGAGANPGLWAGGERLALDARTALDLLSLRHPGRPLYLLGESMGAAVAVIAAGLEPAPPLDGVILSAPAAWSFEMQPWYQRWLLSLAVRLVPGLRPSGRGHPVQASDNVEALLALGRDPLVIKYSRVDTIQGLVELMGEALDAAPQVEAPVLLLRGEHDQLIPEKPVRLLWERLPERPGTQLLFYPDGWHLLLLDLQAEIVIEDIATWMRHPRATPPSAMAGLARQQFETAD